MRLVALNEKMCYLHGLRALKQPKLCWIYWQGRVIAMKSDPDIWPLTGLDYNYCIIII